jgi:outer membrane protein OmpA-like peptidoglycan-associated protein
VSFQPELLLSRRIEAFRIAANFGFASRPTRESLDLSVGSELYAKLGMALRTADIAEFGVSGSIATRASEPFKNRNQTPAELDGIVSFFLPAEVILFASAGIGLGNGYGTPDWRMIGGIRYAPTREKPLPPPPPVQPAPQEPPPVTDRDGDGIVDDRDQCPDVPETVNGFEDEDGCPDAPPQPEPIAAPVVLDRDGDGVADAVDNCPDVPGNPDFQGCPEAQRVRIESDRLAITETVRFKTGKSAVDKRSYTLLNNIAAVMIVHPEIELVEVGGHTDDVGNEQNNLALSQKRAAAVVAYLVKQGVPGSRLAAVGYGESSPLVPGSSKEARAANRRVEFLIKRQPGLEAPAGEPTPKASRPGRRKPAAIGANNHRHH